MKIKIAVKIIAFFAIFILLFHTASEILSTTDVMNYHNIGGFYEEPEDSLDAVYIGSSNCFTYWNSLLAWGEYGISVYPYAGNSFLYFASEYYIREARKIQPDALYIVNINSLTDGQIEQTSMQNMIDYMPPSLNKLQMINHLVEIGDFSMADRMEFYLPMILFHSRWEELTEYDVERPLDGRKGSAVFDQYLKTSTDITEGYVLTEKERSLSDKIIQSTDSLLDYCEEENVKVLFVTVPQAKLEDKRVERLNALNTYIESRGFTVLNYLPDPEGLGLDIKTDFYNTAHTNIHGSAKYTYHLSQYLIEHYGFTDKRQDGDYTAWNQAYDSYLTEIAPFLLDIELDADNRTLELSAPEPIAAAQGAENKITWEKVKGADGYLVYKRSSKATARVRIADTKECALLDPEVESGVFYNYTVLPYRETEQGRLYGKYSYEGVGLQR